VSAAEDRLAAALAAMPYAGLLGMGAGIRDDELITRMPFRDDLVGNTWLPALHGGAIGAFLELTALIGLRLRAEDGRAPLTIGVTVEYLRPGRPKETFARPLFKRLGRNIANVHVEAWQDESRTPIALLQGRFLVGDAPAPD
jgi:uncharacterized protein (TIGR00369 family)